MDIINLTPHKVTVILDNKKVEYPASGTVARLDSVEQLFCSAVTSRVGVPVYSAPEFTAAIGLPDDTTANIIVSMPVAQYLQQKKYWRGAVLSPDTGPGQAVRDKEGVIVGVRRLVIW